MISLPDFSSGANASIPQLLSGATTDAAAGGRCGGGGCHGDGREAARGEDAPESHHADW